MRKLMTQLIKVLPLLVLVCSMLVLDAQTPYGPRVLQDFETSIRNVNQSTTNLGRFEFDIYVLDTDPNQDLVMAGYQAGISFDPGMFAPGAIVTAVLFQNSTYSELNPDQYPPTIQFDAANNQIKISGATPPGSGTPTGPDSYAANGTIFSKTAPGTRVCRVRVTSDLPLVSNSQPNLVFNSSESTVSIYSTKIAHYDYTNATIVWDNDGEMWVWGQVPWNTLLPVIPGEVGGPGTNAHVYENPFFNSNICEDPTLFNVTGSGSYCNLSGSVGIPVGLDGSQPGVNYTLNPGTMVVTGTGTAITFGNQLAGTYTVSALSDGSDPLICNDPVTMTGDAVIIATPPEVSSVSIVADATEVCAGSNVTLTAEPVNGGNPTYQWYVNGVVAGTNSASYTYAPADDDVVYVTLTSDLECVSNNPATSNSITFVVNPVVVPSATIAANPAGAVVTGTEVTFTATPVNGGNIPTYQWFVNTVAVGTGINTYAYVPLDNDDVYVVLTSNAPCASPLTAESNHIIMVVEDEVEAPVAFNVTGGGSYCEGSGGIPVGLDGSESGVTYTLMPGNVSVVGTGSAITFGSQLAGTYTVSGTNAGGTTQMIGSAVVVEDALTTPTFDAIPSICQNSQAPALPGTSLNGIDGTWIPTVIATDVAGTFDYTFTPDAGQCATTATLSITIDPQLVPAVSIVADANNVVAGTTVTFTATPVNGGTPTYTWFVNGVSAGTDAAIFAYIPEDGDQVYVSMTSDMGCVTTPFAISNTIEMTVLAVPCPVFSTWNGNVSSDWFNAVNWTPVALPCETTSVTIPGGCPSYPTLTANASIAALTIQDGGSLIGQLYLAINSDVVVERTIANSFFHLIGSPVDDVTFGDVFLPEYWNEVWAREYNEASGDWDNRLVADHLAVGQGYSVKVNTAPQTATFTGDLNDIDVTRVLSNVNPGSDLDRVGWNLLGNPFPSAIDWDEFSTGDYNAQVAVWDEAGAGNYIYWNGSIGSLTDGIIPTQNGFFVKTSTDGANLTIPLTAQVHSSLGLYKSTVTNALELRATGNSYYDATYVHFNEYATSGFDSNYDAFKMEGLENAPQLYSIADYRLSINELPFEGNEIVDIGFKCGVAGTYSVTASGMESFGSGTPIFLEDLKVNHIQDLRQNPEYNFSYITSDQENRFRLHFNLTTGFEDARSMGITVYSFDHTIVINNTTGQAGNVHIYDLAGREILYTNIGASTTTRIPMQVAVGTYVVKVITTSGAVNQKVFIH